MNLDVAVVGAGPGGCLVARDLERGGLEVGLLDASPRDRLGRSIVVEVTPGDFPRAGLETPAGDEAQAKPAGAAGEAGAGPKRSGRRGRRRRKKSKNKTK